MFIYNENCVMAGRPVSDRVIEQYDGDPYEAGDWTDYEVSPETMEWHENYSKLNNNVFHMRVANSIRKALSW